MEYGFKGPNVFKSSVFSTSLKIQLNHAAAASLFKLKSFQIHFIKLHMMQFSTFKKTLKVILHLYNSGLIN